MSDDVRIRRSATVDDHEIIETGTVIFRNGQDVRLYPFRDEDDLQLRVVLELSDEVSQTVHSKVEWSGEEGQDGFPTMTIRRYFMSGTAWSSSSQPLSLAADEKFTYYVAHHLTIQGSNPEYTAVLYYNVSRRPK